MEALHLEDFTGYRYLSNVQLTRDGKKAAFVVHSANLEKNGYDSNIWLCDVESGGLRQLTAANEERSFLWLDGGKLLFSSKRGKQEEKPGQPETDFYTIQTDGGEAVKAFTVPLAVDKIKALPDGRFILSAVYDHAAPDFSGMDKTQKAEALERYQEEQDYTVLDEIPFWSNGAGVTNKKRVRLWLFEPASGRLQAITEKLVNVEDFQLNEAGNQLVYIGVEFSDKMPLTNGLYSYDIPTGKTGVLIPQGRYNLSSAQFEGEKLLIVANEGKRFGLNENPCFYWYDLGKAPEEALSLFCDPDLSLYSSVGSDCRMGGGEACLPQDGGADLILTDRTCSRLAHLDGQGALSFYTASQGSVDCFDRKGDICLMVAMRDQRLQELYRLNLATGEETLLSNFNEKALKGKYVAVPKPLSFTNRDGVTLDGWVLLPKDYDPSRKYPAILDVHGGPKTIYGTVFYHEMQLWAGMGCFVFFANPRGGDGRGNAFADIRGKYGTIDYTDLMEFTDQVLAQYPAIDAQRVGVTGGSYGGFMTNWIIGHTNRFAAAASQRSISNWISMSCTTDIGYYFGPDQTASTPWDGIDRMWEQSPLKYADQCQTPTLFIHSDEDYRCWQAEGLQMFTALKMHGVPARLCLFKGENHELSRSGKPKHRIRRLREITGWFEKYLGF